MSRGGFIRDGHRFLGILPLPPVGRNWVAALKIIQKWIIKNYQKGWRKQLRPGLFIIFKFWFSYNFERSDLVDEQMKDYGLSGSDGYWRVTNGCQWSLLRRPLGRIARTCMSRHFVGLVSVLSELSAAKQCAQKSLLATNIRKIVPLHSTRAELGTCDPWSINIGRAEYFMRLGAILCGYWIRNFPDWETAIEAMSPIYFHLDNPQQCVIICYGLVSWKWQRLWHQ